MSLAIQALRHIGIEAPLGDDVLLLRSFSAHEAISCLFEFDLDLLSEDYEINFDEIIGQNVTIRMDLPGGGRRYWNGFINRFVQGVSTSVKFAQYRATMVPWLWFLTRTSDCRIFQNKTVPEIVTQIFNDLGFSYIEDRLSGDYRTWIYCVQYRETDFDFVSRLLEKEGIYYYFLHEQGKCTIVLCDSLSKHDPYGDYDTIDYIPDTRSSALQERISAWTVNKKIQSGRFAHTDYNFEKPCTYLMSTEEDPKAHAQADFQIYDYPGEYPEKADGEKYARVRMEALAQPHEICIGQSDSRGICSGYLFTMAKHTRRDQNRQCLIVKTKYQVSAEDYETSGGYDDLCACSFTAMPSSVQFRPARTTPKPTIKGTQTAVVTGPPGEEIYTDEHGRVKVQFHWDREGQFDQNSSCWIRVGQNWAGNRWGGVHIPRIAQEVIVDFLEGDPDRPIIVGSVYNGNNMPPYKLPAEKTKSTIKSDSSLGGGGSNEFRFEDKKGSEEVYIHAEKDQNNVVKNDKTTSVGHDRTEDIGNDHTEVIHGSMNLSVDRTKSEVVTLNSAETVGIAKELTIGGLYQVTVGAAHNATVGGAKTVEVGAFMGEVVAGAKTVAVGGNHSKTIGGKESVTVTKDRSDTVNGKLDETVKKKFTLKAKAITLQAEDEIVIKVGKAKIAMKKNGKILVEGKDIMLKASGKINQKASGDVIIKGSKVKAN